MAFGKFQKQAVAEKRYLIDNPGHLEEIKAFEKELKPFMEKPRIIIGREVSGFELYLHDKDYIKISFRNPRGGIVLENIEKYREARSKYDALQDLWFRRDKAEKMQSERLQTLAV